MMERTLFFFIFVVLFATFGSIESRWDSGWENRGSSAPSPWGHRNGSLPTRPSNVQVSPPRYGNGNVQISPPRYGNGNVQVSPPRYGNGSWAANDRRIPFGSPPQPSRICNGSGSSNWPCGPSDTVQPPAYAGSGRNDGHPLPGHGYNDNVGLGHRPYPYGGSSYNYHGSNRTVQTSPPSYRPVDGNRGNSTRLYPLLPGSGYDSNNAQGIRTRPTIPQYHGNSGFPDFNRYPSQTNPSGRVNGTGY